MILFIYVSLFQSKIQKLLSESDEYSSYKLRNYSCTVKYIKKSVTKYENDISFVKIALGSD